MLKKNSEVCPPSLHVCDFLFEEKMFCSQDIKIMFLRNLRIPKSVTSS